MMTTKAYIRSFSLILTVFFMLSILSTVSLATSYDVVFANIPDEFNSFRSPLSSYAQVNSKWNQPRTIGTSPHQGVDLHGSGNQAVYAVYDGWWEYLGSTSGRLLVDHDRDGAKDSGDYYVYYYHIDDHISNQYVDEGDQVCKIDVMSAAHLHFGVIEGGDWARNIYHYRWQSNWDDGERLDVYSNATVKYGDTASIVAYHYDDVDGHEYPTQVYIYHRPRGYSNWSVSTMYRASGNEYRFDLGPYYNQYDYVQWIVRIKRGSISSEYTWAPSKWEDPNDNPNYWSGSYPYFEFRIY